MAVIDRQTAFSGTKEVTEPLRFDAARLESYLTAAVPGIRGPLALRQFRSRVNLNLVALLPAVVVFLFCLQRMGHFTPPFDCALGCWP